MTIHYDTHVRDGKDLERWAHSLRAKCRTPGRMRETARTLLEIRTRAHEAAGWKPTEAEALRLEAKGAALNAEAWTWLEQLAVEALAHG